jgi:hypothetical protein
VKKKKKGHKVLIAREGKCNVQPALRYARRNEDVWGSGGTASPILNHDIRLK